MIKNLCLKLIVNTPYLAARQAREDRQLKILAAGGRGNTNARINTIKSLAFTLLFMVLLNPGLLRAQVPVIDAANLAKNAAIFFKNAAMLKIMIDNIQKGDGDWETILPFLHELEEVIKQGEALAYGADNISGVFEDKFPGYQIVGDLWVERSQMWTDTQLHTLRNILEAVHIQNENFSEEQPFIAGILDQSNQAVGHMQALQHGNALIAATAKQLVKLRQLTMSQINAETVYRSAEVARRAESEAKGVSWATAASRKLQPMSADDPRGIGDLEFINPLNNQPPPE